MSLLFTLKYLIRSIFSRPFEKVIYHLSGMFPRDKRLWVSGAQKQSFSCNPKHFFIATSLNNELPVRCVWLTQSNEVVQKVRKMGFESYNIRSVKGVYVCLRAGFYFVNCDTKDISFIFSKNACYINMWHGIPLKKLQRKTENKSLKQLHVRRMETFDRVFNPRKSFRYDYIVSTSEYVSSYSLSKVFDVNEKQCLDVGYPRTDIFFNSKAEIESYIFRYEYDLLPILDWIRGKGKVFLYAPTWRDTLDDFIQISGIDFKDLNSQLEISRSVLIVKLHPYTKLDFSQLDGLNRIKLLDKDSDIYPLLTYVDTLITDYSSIFFDYLLLDRPIIFFPFDLERYLEECRGLYFEYEDVTPGVKVFDYKGLISALTMIDTDFWVAEREEIKKRFWNRYSGNASQKLASRLLE